jgi:glyoxylase-like metal-dependent hydrolase (beta-lactamase superfamily II)
MKITSLLLLSLIVTTQLISQDIQVSKDLILREISKNTYIHTQGNNNGIVYINNNEAIIVSTPWSDIETQNLIDWATSKSNKIVAYVIDRWHPDAMEGLDIVQKNGIKSYANELTRKIAKKKGLPIPDIGFKISVEINVGNEKIKCHYLGEAHTTDGIVVWIPEHKILFAGNGIRNYNGWVGNIGDANLEEWSKTAQNIKDEYGSAKIVIPGHGKHGGTELVDYTINLYRPSKWGEILKTHNIIPKKIFHDYGEVFEIAESDSNNNGIRYLSDAIIFMDDTNRYIKIVSSFVEHDVEKHKIVSDYGRLQIFDKTKGISNKFTDLYYERLIVFKIEDSVGYRIIIKEMVN